MTKIIPEEYTVIKSGTEGTMDHAHIVIMYDIVEKQMHIMDRIKQIKDYKGGHELEQAILRQKESIMWLDSWIDHTEGYE